MAWFAVEDTLHGHPKALDAGLAAMGLWCMAGSYCTAYLTDGFIPSGYVAQFKNGFRYARELVDAGLWDKAEKKGIKGFAFHDWQDRNPDSETIKARRKSNAERQRRHRERQKDQPTLRLVDS